MDIASLTVPISKHEFATTMNAACNGAPGTDGIDAVMLKAAPKEAHTILRNNMNDILSSIASIPPEWQTAHIILLPKEGAPDNPANYQPISLLQTTYKVFTKILTEQLSAIANKYILNHSQLGFHKGMSTQSALHTLTNVLEEAKHSNKEVHVAYVDFHKAFDSIRHQELFDILEFYGLGQNFIKLIHDLYTGCHTDIYINNSNCFPVAQGVRQGNTLSPLLFILAINPALDWINQPGTGYEFSNGVQVPSITYCDDIVLTGSCALEVQTTFHQLVTFGKWIGLDINPTKSTYTSARSKAQAILNMTGSCEGIPYTTPVPWLPPGTSYQYMGVLINANLDWNNHLTHTRSKVVAYQHLIHHKHLTPVIRYMLATWSLTLLWHMACAWSPTPKCGCRTYRQSPSPPSKFP